MTKVLVPAVIIAVAVGVTSSNTSITVEQAIVTIQVGVIILITELVAILVVISLKAKKNYSMLCSLNIS